MNCSHKEVSTLAKNIDVNEIKYKTSCRHITNINIR
nr:MAG TPA: hypothetical protein [Caudoviricetes sp.]DAH93415.1 MAG TPA: hypothetical protein [Caudoviricetes sp.]